MAKYMILAHYTADGAKGLVREGGSARRKHIGELVERLGGRLESFHFAFGEVDAYVTVDLPDVTAAIALSLAVNQSGGVHISAVPLIPPEALDGATQKTVAYRAPGH